MKEEKAFSRKEFLKFAGTGLATLAVSSLPKKAYADNVRHIKRKYRFAMVIDLRRCVGCHSCSMACKVENNIPLNLEREDRKIFWNQVFFKEEGQYSYVKQKIFNRPCFHCDNHPCVNVCPTGATYHDEEKGLVLQRYERCIGCRYCALACPYGVRYFNWSRPNYVSKDRLNPEVETRYKGIVEKCTFCIHRLEKVIEKAEAEGRSIKDEELHYLPACVQTCMSKARHFGDLNDPESTVSKLVRSGRAFRLLEDLGTEPNVYYLKEA